MPPAYEEPTIDEAAEEAAAAAEAGNIGGTVSDYAGPEGELADPAEAPLAEAGEGEAEGQEQAEAELRDAAEDREPGLSPEQAQIDEAIDQAANPLASEQVEPGKPADDAEWRTWSGPHATRRRSILGCEHLGGNPRFTAELNPSPCPDRPQYAPAHEHARGHAAERPVPARRPDRRGRHVDGL